MKSVYGKYDHNDANYWTDPKVLYYWDYASGAANTFYGAGALIYVSF